LLSLLVGVIFVSTLVNLTLPRLLGQLIDQVQLPALAERTAMTYLILSMFSFIALACAGIISTVISERIGRDLRKQLIEKLSLQPYQFVVEQSVPKLLTNITSDVDAIRGFFGQGLTVIFSAVILIVGGAVMMLVTQWMLACIVLIMIPFIFFWFSITFGKIGKFFFKGQVALDHLNSVLTETLNGSAIIRVLAAQYVEINKFAKVNEEARNINLQIVRLFASLIPGIMFISNLAVLTIVFIGGRQVMAGSISLGTLTTFYNYVSVFVMPLLLVGFVSNQMVRAATTYSRLQTIISAPTPLPTGQLAFPKNPEIVLKHVGLKYGEREVLKDVSTTLAAGKHIAILGPTGAGKSQLFAVLANMTPPSTGTVMLNEHALSEYDQDDFSANIRFVFQESLVFNASVRENLTFDQHVPEAELHHILEVAELAETIAHLPQGLDTVLNEGGSNFSGGQKQRLMLARALVSHPRILCLDDFTARVDLNTEKQIMKNLLDTYPNLTLLVIAQKIESVKHFDHILFVMEGELLAEGTHQELLVQSFEYQQLYKSQQSLAS